MGTDDWRVARGVAVACLVICAFLLAWLLADLLLLIFAAILLAVALSALAAPVARATGWSARLALIPTLLVLLGVLVAISLLFGGLIRTQVGELVERLPDAWATFRDRFELHDISQELQRQAGNAMPSGASVLSFVTGLTSNIASAVLGVVLVFAGGIYLAVQPNLYLDGILLLAPSGMRGRVRTKLARAGRALRKFLLAQLVSMVVVGLLIGAGLAIIGVPSAVALGLLAGLAEFVPMVGPIAAAIPALLIALGVGMEEAAWTLLLFVVVQQLESNLLAPLIQQEMVKVPAAVTLFAVIGFGMVLGPLGVLLATPLTVLAFSLAKDEE